jgi:hypothetical protein
VLSHSVRSSQRLRLRDVPPASDEVDAVVKADDLLEYLERVGIRYYLDADGTRVRGGAGLSVSPVAETPRPALHLRITRPDGTVIEKYSSPAIPTLPRSGSVSLGAVRS